MEKVRNFSKVGDAAPVPDLIELQIASYARFLQAQAEPAKRKKEGLEALLREIFPIVSYDENMTLDKKRMADICDLIVQRGLHIEWFTPNGVRADTLDEPLLRKMKRSGCKKIRVAPESGVQRVVNEVIGKNLDLKKVEQAVVLCKKVGIKVGCFFVLGVIGETKAEIEETIKFAYKLRSLGADSLIFSIAMPLYGTAFYEQAKSGGFLRDGFCDFAMAATAPLIETPEFSADDLMELCAKAYLANPTFTKQKILRAIRNPRKTVKIILKRK